MSPAKRVIPKYIWSYVRKITIPNWYFYNVKKGYNYDRNRVWIHENVFFLCLDSWLRITSLISLHVNICETGTVWMQENSWGGGGKLTCSYWRRCLELKPIRYKNCPWWACLLLLYKDNMGNICRWPHRRPLYSSLKLLEHVHSENFSKVSGNQKQDLPMIAMFSAKSRIHILKSYYTLYLVLFMIMNID